MFAMLIMKLLRKKKGSSSQKKESMEYVKEDQRRSLQLSMLTGSVMAMDFMIVYLSIFEYWTKDLGGSLHAFGLVFACYDLTQVVFLPVFGVCVQYVGFRALFILSLVLNMVGNILYSTALSGDSDTAITRFVAGRLIAGIGSASYVLILGHMVTTVPREHRGEGFVTFRLYTFYGRLIGPLIGFALLYVPESSLGSLKFDGKTLPGWVVVLLDTVLLALYCTSVFKEPGCDNRLLTNDSDDDNHDVSGSHRGYESIEEDANENEEEMFIKKYNLTKKAATSIGIIFVANFLLMFGFWCIYGQLMPITIIRYGMDVKEASSVYGVCGAATYIASVTYRRVVRKKVGEGTLAVVGTLFIILSCLLTMQYDGDRDSDKSLQWMWYVGCGLLVFGFSLASSATAALYSLVVDDSTILMPLLALIAKSSALGRFAGPSFASLILSYGAIKSSEPCDREHTANCSLEQSSLNTLISIVAGFVFIVCAVAFFYYRRLQRACRG